MEIIINVQDDEKFESLFDSSCLPWTKDRMYNILFLSAREEHFNSRLKCVGHLFLNEVYDTLGLPRTKIGQVACWIYDDESNGRVDFGIRESITGSPDIELHFNCDNYILDRI